MLKTSLLLALYVTLLRTAAQTNALECYVCSYLFGQSDATCLTNASAVRALNCTKKYCLTVRQEAIHNGNKVISFLRDCQDKPIILNAIKTDNSFRTYYRSCQQNLCNGHNGRVYNSSGSLVSGSAGTGAGISGNHNAIMPGKNCCLKATADIIWPLFLLLMLVLLLGNSVISIKWL